MSLMLDLPPEFDRTFGEQPIHVGCENVPQTSLIPSRITLRRCHVPIYHEHVKIRMKLLQMISTGEAYDASANNKNIATPWLLNIGQELSPRAS
jgi:hypothetical protein